MKKLFLVCSTSVLALQSVPVMAQGPAAEEVAAEAASEGDQEITVTGSRVVSDGSRAPTPVTVVTSEDLTQTAPSNIPDALNKLPVFANSSNQNTGGTFAATASQKGNFLNLRALGTQRLLTLLNGTRAVPTASSLINGVDANLLPQMLVSRVDVVTGGASAVYGSDAISGVVNYVLDEKFKGLKANAQVGLSTHGDDLSYRYGVAVGTSLGDRVHIIGSYEHFASNGIPSLNNRSWATPGDSIVGGGSAANPFGTAPNATTNVMTYGGRVATGIFNNRRFLPDGTLVPFISGTPTATGVTDIGGDGVRYTTSMAAELKTDQAFLRTAIDVTDTIEFYAQGSYATSFSKFDTQAQNHRPGSNRNITIFAENAFLRPELAAQMVAAGQASFNMGRFFRDIPLMFTESKTDYYSVQTGLKGEFGSNWRWDVNYVNGRSKLNFLASEFDSRKFFAAVDAVRDPATGRVVCRVTLTNPTFLPGCVPMNVMGEGNISTAAYEYARSASRVRTINKMEFVNFNVSGDLFNLPAGPVAVAFGAEYRTQSLNQSSNADPFSLATPAQRAAYFQDIRAVPGSALNFLVVNQGVAIGSQTVKEAYGEVDLPLLKDKSFAQNLSLNLAARVTDYKTSGTVVTWKVGANWTPVEGLRFRGTQSRDIAAPSLYDLYAGPNVRNLSPTDPLTGATNVIPIINQGNVILRPEMSDTTALGVVLQPSAIPGLTFSADLYKIKIKDAIAVTSETAQLAECHASNGTAPVCALIIRPFPYSNSTLANAPTQIFVLPQNLSVLETKGIDFEIGYTTSLDDLLPSVGGDLSLRAFVNYLDSYATQSSPTQAVLERAGRSIAGFGTAGLPKWRALFSQSYQKGAFGISFTERFTGSNLVGVTEVFAPTVRTKLPNKVYVDANLTYDVMEDDKAQIFLNVQNLFNVTPPIIQFGQAADLNVPTDTSKYDIVGRYFTAVIRVKF